MPSNQKKSIFAIIPSNIPETIFAELAIMNTPLLNKLREHLASISKEEFKKEWAETKALGLEGPTVEEFIQSTSMNVVATEPNLIELVNSRLRTSNGKRRRR